MRSSIGRVTLRGEAPGFYLERHSALVAAELLDWSLKHPLRPFLGHLEEEAMTVARFLSWPGALGQLPPTLSRTGFVLFALSRPAER